MAFLRSAMAVLSLVSVLLSAYHCNGWGDDLNLVAENTKLKVDDATTDAKDKAASWAGWAYDKFSDGIGISGENAKEASQGAIDKSSDAASKATDATVSAASDSARYAAEKVDQGGKNTEKIIKMATNAGDAAAGAFAGGKEKVADAVNSATEKTKAGASHAYDETKQKLGESYDGVAEGIDKIRAKITTEL